jgi:hypothetical protein
VLEEKRCSVLGSLFRKVLSGHKRARSVLGSLFRKFSVLEKVLGFRNVFGNVLGMALSARKIAGVAKRKASLLRC